MVLEFLSANGYKYVLVDEVTALEDFISVANIFLTALQRIE